MAGVDLGIYQNPRHTGETGGSVKRQKTRQRSRCPKPLLGPLKEPHEKVDNRAPMLEYLIARLGGGMTAFEFSAVGRSCGCSTTPRLARIGRLQGIGQLSDDRSPGNQRSDPRLSAGPSREVMPATAMQRPQRYGA